MISDSVSHPLLTSYERGLLTAGSESGLNGAVSRKWAEPGTPARPIASDLLEFSCMCARRAQYACHQSTGTGMCIFSQFSEFRIQTMHSTLYVYFQSIFRNMDQNMR